MVIVASRGGMLIALSWSDKTHCRQGRSIRDEAKAMRILSPKREMTHEEFRYLETI